MSRKSRLMNLIVTLLYTQKTHVTHAFGLAGLLVLSATPALPNELMSAGVLLSCASYTFIAQAWNLSPGSRYSISYNFVLTSTIGAPSVGSGNTIAPPVVGSGNTITFTTGSTTSTQTLIQGLAPPLIADYTGLGSATLVNLTTITTSDTALITFSPSPVSCAPLTLGGIVRPDPVLAEKGSFEVTKTDLEWRSILTPAQYREGVFVCAGCHLPLFKSETKYDSGTGWPSFWSPIEGTVGTRSDRTLWMERTEVQ
jgi:hypothetical protein